MFKIWVIGVALLSFLLIAWSPRSNILLLNLIILGTGTQNVTADRDTRRSNYSNKYKGVRQQGIIKY